MTKTSAFTQNSIDSAARSSAKAKAERDAIVAKFSHLEPTAARLALQLHDLLHAIRENDPADKPRQFSKSLSLLDEVGTPPTVEDDTELNALIDELGL